MPRGRASAFSASISQHCPYKWTGKITLVRSVSLLATECGSKFSVHGSTSAKTTFAPSAAAAFAVEIQLIGVVMTSSPGWTPAAIKAKERPAVAEDTAKPYSVPQYAANSRSNCCTLAPQEGALAFITSSTAAFSSSPYVEPWENSSSNLALGRDIKAPLDHLLAGRNRNRGH